jgi:hypothetical protein
MIVTKETVPLDAELCGEGRQRRCRVRVLRRLSYPDESRSPACVSYSRCQVDDPDDFPDGNYELRFEGHRIPLRKYAGQYACRLGDPRAALDAPQR